ncbi:hypothetical protein I5677_00790 [Mobilitalea sibirica]|uniref:Uncharacterized protein n=1 Tax=Mobilitalea sibirica TaxID=1462919 RepID=A0A8J7HBN4_9FIRM|nr:hypothetical protein [Mobilitalea sibirica]MBH1939424.1 hypothetical protein [Mobilitalea sibirica]
MEFIIFFLVFIVPGLIAVLAYNIVAQLRVEVCFTGGLIFDLLIFIIMITGLYFFRDITQVPMLLEQFICLSFTRNYALLSILIGIILGVGFGFLKRLFFWIRN